MLTGVVYSVVDAMLVLKVCGVSVLSIVEDTVWMNVVVINVVVIGSVEVEVELISTPMQFIA